MWLSARSVGVEEPGRSASRRRICCGSVGRRGRRALVPGPVGLPVIGPGSRGTIEVDDGDGTMEQRVSTVGTRVEWIRSVCWIGGLLAWLLLLAVDGSSGAVPRVVGVTVLGVLVLVSWVLGARSRPVEGGSLASPVRFAVDGGVLLATALGMQLAGRPMWLVVALGLLGGGLLGLALVSVVRRREGDHGEEGDTGTDPDGVGVVGAGPDEVLTENDPSDIEIARAREHAAEDVHPELGALFAVQPSLVEEFGRAVRADRRHFASLNERRALGYRVAATVLMAFALFLMVIVGGTEPDDSPLFLGAVVVGAGVLTLWCCEVTRIREEGAMLGGRIAVGVHLASIGVAVLAMATGVGRRGWGPLRAGGALTLGVVAVALVLLWFVVRRRGRMRGELPLPRRGRPLTLAVSQWCADRRARLSAGARERGVALQAMTLGVPRRRVREDLELTDRVRRNWFGTGHPTPEGRRRRGPARPALVGGAVLAAMVSPFVVNPFLGRTLVALFDVPVCGGEMPLLGRWVVMGALGIPSVLAAILAFRWARWRVPGGRLAIAVGGGLGWLVLSWTPSLFGGRTESVSGLELARRWDVDWCQADFLRVATSSAAAAGMTMTLTLFSLAFMVGRVRRSYCTAFALFGSSVAGVLLVVWGAG